MSFAWEERRSPIEFDGLGRSRHLGLGMVTAAVLCLHAGLLLLRPEVSGAQHVSVARAMAVRLLPARVTDVVAVRDTQSEVRVASTSTPNQELRASLDRADASDSRTPADLAERRPRPGATLDAVAPAAGSATLAAPPANAALAPEPDYLFGAQMDPGPRPLASIEPEYPEAANLQEGKVVLRLLISEAGVVNNVAVVRAEPKGVFEEAALVAFRAAKFSPGLVLGVPAKSQITVEVEFMPINRGARIAGRTY